MDNLLSLRDEVYRTRSNKFHWDVSNSIELKAQKVRREYTDTEVEVATLESVGGSSLSSRLKYEMGWFVAIKGQAGRFAAEEVWVGRIVDRVKRNNGSIRLLEVHWYELYGDGDMLTGKYRPFLLRNKSTKRKMSLGFRRFHVTVF